MAENMAVLAAAPNKSGKGNMAAQPGRKGALSSCEEKGREEEMGYIASIYVFCARSFSRYISLCSLQGEACRVRRQAVAGLPEPNLHSKPTLFNRLVRKVRTIFKHRSSPGSSRNRYNLLHFAGSIFEQ